MDNGNQPLSRWSPKRPIFKDIEITEQQRLFTARLKDNDDNVYPVTMQLCLWDWFLALTHYNIPLTHPIDRALTWKKSRGSKLDIDCLIPLYLAEHIYCSDDDDASDGWWFDYNHKRVMAYLEADSHRFYDDLEDLHWRIDGQKTYPMMPPPYPRNHDILYE